MLDFKFSQRSLNNLEGVHSDLIVVVTHALLISEIDFVVIEGLRTPERQQQLFDAGATRTTRSRHMTGHAVDLAVWWKGAIRWDWPFYDRLSVYVKEAAKHHNIDITWGGDWQSFRDGPHYELSRKTYKETTDEHIS